MVWLVFIYMYMYGNITSLNSPSKNKVVSHCLSIACMIKYLNSLTERLGLLVLRCFSNFLEVNVEVAIVDRLIEFVE